MKLQSLVTLKFDGSKPMGILGEFANTMLSREKSKEWSEKSTSFSDAYLDLRKLFQEETKYRFGICDGAHRINAIYNIIAGIQIEKNRLKTMELPCNNFNDGGNNMAYNTTWQVGRYNNLSK